MNWVTESALEKSKFRAKEINYLKKLGILKHPVILRRYISFSCNFVHMLWRQAMEYLKHKYKMYSEGNIIKHY